MTMTMDLIRHIAGLYGGKAIKGDITQVFITGNEIWMAQQVLAEHAEDAHGERERFEAWWATSGLTKFKDTAQAAWEARATLAQPSTAEFFVDHAVLRRAMATYGISAPESDHELGARMESYAEKVIEAVARLSHPCVQPSPVPELELELELERPDVQRFAWTETGLGKNPNGQWVLKSDYDRVADELASTTDAWKLALGMLEDASRERDAAQARVAKLEAQYGGVCLWRQNDSHWFSIECGGSWTRDDTRDSPPSCCINCGKETHILSPFHDGKEWQKAPTFEEGRAKLPKAAAPVAQAGQVPEDILITWRGFWLEEQIAEMVSVLARLREAPIDDRALVMAVADAGQCRARALTMDELLAAIQAQGVGHA